MVRSCRRRGIAPLALALALVSAPVQAGDKEEAEGAQMGAGTHEATGVAKVGPGQGTGSRHLPGHSASDAETTPDSGTEPGGAADDSRASHRTGRPPRHPRSRLPNGAAARKVNDVGRRIVAGGPTDEDVAAGTDDPELRALREAERVLFPKPLAGLSPGWSWQPGESTPTVRANGLPLGSQARAARSVDPPSDRDAAWLEGLAMPDIPVHLDARVVKYLKFYKDSPRGRRIARAWAKKSGRLTPALKAEFAKAGLPTDLVWISLIESGHNPTIFSPAGAAGLWQFIPESARMYGLTVDRWVDERLDPQRATAAAIKYLRDLRRRFGNWELAMAAYNMGHGGLLRAVRKFNTNNFWVLSRYEAGVPWETTLYVPKVFAIAVVMNNKSVFGLDDVQPDPPLSFDTVYVDKGVPLSEVARASGVSEGRICELNSQYLKERTPPTVPNGAGKRWPVRVPAGLGAPASEKLAKASRGKGGFRQYVTRFGDTLKLIAAEQGTSESELGRLNELSSGEYLAEGTILLVPSESSGSRTGEDDADRPVVVVPARRFEYTNRQRVFYRVRGDDTLAAIARAFGVTTSELITWNALDDSANLQEEMTLQIFVRRTADLSRVRYLEPHEARVFVAGTDEFFDYFEGLKGRRRITVTVEEGDTLSTIGKRYGMSTGMMERINRHSRRKKLTAGDQVIVYTKQDVGAQDAPASAESLHSIEAPRPDVLPAPPAGSVAPPNGRRAVR